MERPRLLAAIRFTANVEPRCSTTGISPGLVPWKIRCTMEATAVWASPSFGANASKPPDSAKVRPNPIAGIRFSVASFPTKGRNLPYPCRFGMRIPSVPILLARSTNCLKWSGCCMSRCWSWYTSTHANPIFTKSLKAARVLRSLGIATTSIGARVLWNSPGGPAARVHMLLLVRLPEGTIHRRNAPNAEGLHTCIPQRSRSGNLMF